MATLTIEDCKRLLHQHAELRMPVFDAEDSAGFKVEKIENYMGDLAVARGDLEEARLWADHSRHTLEETWEAVEGWQQQVPAKATGPQIVAAKRKIDPVTYAALRECKFVISKLGDQIKRLEKDEENASRRYTLIVGA